MQVKSIASGLHILATPIGTANDITLRALNILASADVLAAEDTRVLRKLMDIHAIALNGRRIVPYHDHNGDAQRPKLLAALEEGKSVAYASDAGTPLIADPGFGLAKAVTQAGFKLHVSPGASAVLTALCLAGLPTDKFYFGGFLPNKTTQRVKALLEISELKSTLVYYESPKRSLACLKDMAKVFGGGRNASLCRELTKKFEEVISGTLDEVIEKIQARDSLRGEVVLVVGPPVAKEINEEDIRNSLIKLLQTERVKDAASEIATKYDMPRRTIYEMALKLKDEI